LCDGMEMKVWSLLFDKSAHFPNPLSVVDK